MSTAYHIRNLLKAAGNHWKQLPGSFLDCGQEGFIAAHAPPRQLHCQALSLIVTTPVLQPRFPLYLCFATCPKVSSTQHSVPLLQDCFWNAVTQCHGELAGFLALQSVCELIVECAQLRFRERGCIVVSSTQSMLDVQISCAECAIQLAFKQNKGVGSVLPCGCFAVCGNCFPGAPLNRQISDTCEAQHSDASENVSCHW